MANSGKLVRLLKILLSNPHEVSSDIFSGVEKSIQERTRLKIQYYRIHQIEILPETYIIPRNFSATAFFESSWLLEQGETVKVKLRFYPEAPGGYGKIRIIHLSTPQRWRTDHYYMK